MTSFLRNLPIKRKLAIITMLTSGAALVLASIGFTAYEQINSRKSMVDDHLSTAKMIGDNSAASLTFNEPDSAAQTLKSLSAETHLVAAAIYDKEGKPFAQYQRAGTKENFTPPPVKNDGHQFGDNHMELFHQINLAGEKSGTVYLRSDLEEMRARLWRYGLIVVVVILTASLVVFLLSTRLQRIISEPISHLANVASAVATDRDYSVRAVKQSEDELGQLIDGFNEMLAQIQARDADLQQAQDLLEKRVEERTAELQLEVAERQRSEEAMRDSNQRFEIVTRATTDVIWDWNLETDQLWWNEHFQTVFGYSLTEIGATSGSWSARIHPDDVADVVKSIHSILDRREHLWSGEYRFLRKDGSYAYVHDRGYVVHDDAGKPVRMLGAMQDISERKKAEIELENMHKQLVDTSRQAGMAEVATGVLHNVGNVLNSVNVSATLLADGLKKLKTPSLSKAVNLLREHESDLGTFLTSDSRGRQLPGYLAQLAGYFGVEQEKLLQEADQLRQNIEHIKDIVAMQQNYAKVSGVTEIVKITDLVEDSLRINVGALKRHGVETIREFEAIPPFNVDRHKVLQILVNLVRNAKYACEDAGHPDKRLTVRVTSADNRVRIAVIDNGVGIPAENLTRIFAHGFTTRKDGHGFGLHSGALAAREMGGSLSVHSDGPGRGASFTLELPLEPLERAA